MTARSARLGVGIVGAGRVGTVLGAALRGAGHSVVAVSAISAESLERADALLPGVPVLPIPEVIERSELVLLAVPEDQLPALVTGLAEAGAWQPGQLVVHTAARHGTSVLMPAVAKGVIPLAIHPALVFTGTSIDLGRIHEARFAVTAPGPVQPIGQALVVEMGGEPVLIAEDDREAYADALDLVRAFSTGTIDLAVSGLAAIGIGDPGRLLGPVVRSAVEQALGRLGPRPREDGLEGLGSIDG